MYIYYGSSVHCLKGCDHGFANLKMVDTILVRGGPIGEYREGIHPQQRWWKSDGIEDPHGVADDVLEMWGAERIRANNNDLDDVLLADLRRTLPAMQAAANEEADIQRALQESRESYRAMRRSKRLAMYASAANYGLAATLRARADGTGPLQLYPSGSTPSQSQTPHDPDNDYQVLSSDSDSD